MQSPENILANLFDLLPLANFSNSKTAKVGFGWGSQHDLNKYIKVLGSKQKYPLIWLVSSEWIENPLAKTIKGNRKRFVIAINSTKLENLNPSIWNTDFEVTLNPIKDNVLLALANSGRSILRKDNISIERVPNYSDGQDATETIDIWNAIVIDCDIELNHNSTCFNNIKFI